MAFHAPARTRTLAALSAALLLAGGLLVTGGAPASADGLVFVVDQDTTSFTPQPGELSWAIEEANAAAGPDTIDIQVPGITLGSDLPDIVGDITILGNGATIDGVNNSYAALAIWDASATISDLTVLAPNSAGVYASPAAGSMVLLTDVNVIGATSYAGVSIGTAVDTTVTVDGGVLSDNNVGLEISGWSGGAVEVTGTELVGNDSASVDVTASNDTSVVIDGALLDGIATTNVGMQMELYGSSQVAVTETLITAHASQGVAAAVFGDSRVELGAGTEVTDNTGQGARFYASGGVVIDQALISRNGLADGESGLDLRDLYDDSTATISRTTVSDNGGSGISAAVLDQSALDIINSTISGNAGDGVDIELSSNARIRHSTITDNSRAGLAVEGADGTAAITHSIVTGNALAPLQDSDLMIAGSDVGLEWSLVGTLLDFGTVSEGDGVTWDVVDAGLEPLADNGGVTQTHALTDASPAVDAGDPALTGEPATDQRALARVSGDAIDLGAFEIQGEAPVDPSPSPEPTEPEEGETEEPASPDSEEPTGTDAEGSETDAPASGAQGELAETGPESATLLLWAAALVMGGLVLVGSRAFTI